MSPLLDPRNFEVDHHTDIWIAHRVMEFPTITKDDRYADYISFGGVIVIDRAEIFRFGSIPDLFQPSSKLEDAGHVLRMMKTKGWWYHISGDPGNKDTMVLFGKDKGEENDEIHSAYAESEPLAICRAAGLAVIGEK